ncbi:MAG: ABC transporter ATP-binding protein, partial [Clostridia bacterium]|nr:ABC transporter ATP-binding protein [Clostridia bacterium]
MKDTIKRLLGYVGKYKYPAFLTIFCMIGEVVFEVLIPKYMALLIDNGISLGDTAYVYRMGGVMILLTLGAMLLGMLGVVFGARSSTGFAMNLQNAVFGAVEDFSFKNTDKFTTPSLITRMTNDITNVQQAFQMTIRMAMRSPAQLILATFMAIRISGRLSLVLLCALPVLAIGLALIAKITYPRFIAMLHRYDDMNGSAQENLIAIRVVKAFVRGDYETKKFKKSAQDVRDAQFSAEKILILNGPLMTLTMYACILAVVGIGGSHIATGQMTSGELISFISYISSILISLMMLSMYFMMLIMSSASAKRLGEVLDEVPDIDENRSSTIQVKDGSVDFDHVDFSYSGSGENPTLTDIDLHIQSGETIGVIGGSGSGKTSLVQLIPRLYEATAGAVKVGGVNVKDYSTAELRGAIGMVLQKNVLFSGTIRENLKWGDPNATDEEIEAACRIACAHDFILSFPKGYDTDLGQGGVNVSGGQKQRLCIARALLKN